MIYLTQFKRWVNVIAASVILASACGTALAQNVKAQPDNALALRHIMQDLEKNTQAIGHGIEEKDWPLVAKLAALIADHPTPPLGEKVRILTYLGTDALAFRGLDKEAQAAATAIQKAAGKEDGPGVIAAFGKMQAACMACHNSYRAPFLQHFYGKQ
jgi:hypothetical protein